MTEAVMRNVTALPSPVPSLTPARGRHRSAMDALEVGWVIRKVWVLGVSLPTLTELEKAPTVGLRVTRGANRTREVQV